MRTLCLLLGIVTLFWAGAAHAQVRRVALVVSVSQYEHAAQLTNTPADATLVHDALVENGFTLPPVLANPTRIELDSALRDFTRAADNADVAVLYFAGHGMQQYEDNWLIPRDAELARPEDVLSEGIRLRDVVTRMNRARLRIIFLDACRNNPFSARWPTMMTTTSGLAEISRDALPSGTVISYSAGPRQQAPDNGVYARALAQHMREEGVELNAMLNRVRNDVMAVSPNLDPDATIALGTTPFYFRAAAAPVVQTSVTPGRTSLGVAAFGVAVRAGRRADYDRYLDRYPEGDLAVLARMLRDGLAPEALAPGNPPPRCEAITTRLYFDWDRASLNPGAVNEIEQATARRSPACGRPRISVFANQTLSDEEYGGDADPATLSAGAIYGRFVQRARSVRDAMIAHGWPAEGFDRIGIRSPDSVVTDRDPAERFVEVVVQFD